MIKKKNKKNHKNKLKHKINKNNSKNNNEQYMKMFTLKQNILNRFSHTLF